MKNPSKKKGRNGRRTKTSKRRAPKRTEKTETVTAKKERNKKFSILFYKNELPSRKNRKKEGRKQENARLIRETNLGQSA